MMMEKKKMLTKKSESNMNYFQCQHNNKGYCKFGHQCRYQHFNQICEKKVCRENECPSRHPKPCKNGQRCRFLKNNCCAYDHQYDSIKQKDLLSDQIKEGLEEVEELKVEIRHLKNTIQSKETELKEQKDEVENLSEKVKDLVVKNENLKTDNEHLLERISFKHLELERIKENFNCDKCGFKAETMTEFNVHLNSDHGEEKEKDITCKVFDLKFKREFDMQIHNSAKHSVKSFGFTATKEKKAFLFPNIPLK